VFRWSEVLQAYVADIDKPLGADSLARRHPNGAVGVTSCKLSAAQGLIYVRYIGLARLPTIETLRQESDPCSAL